MNKIPTTLDPKKIPDKIVVPALSLYFKSIDCVLAAEETGTPNPDLKPPTKSSRNKP